MLLSTVAEKNLKIQHLDVKTVLWNATLTEEIYMKQPEGFVDSGQQNMGCRLKKSLYGLKQARRFWNDLLNKSLLEMKLICAFITVKNSLFWYVDHLVSLNTSNPGML